MKKRHILLELLWAFFKIGLFTFGGGYAMIPIIEDICVEKKKWITHDEMMNLTVIAESTPGPIAINCAAYVGNSQAGFIGATVATFGIVTPSFAIIYAISTFLNRFLEIPIVADAFMGIKVAVGLLIINAAVNMIKKMERSAAAYVILIVCCAIMMLINIFSWNFSSLYLMLIVAAFSVPFFTWQNARKKKGGAEK